ncbi:CYTH domain-containing protein [Rhizobium beringeri]
MRVRIIDNAHAVLTVKLRTGRLRREEFEYEIPYADALEMIAYATSVVDKTRYEVNHCGCLWEVDVYSGVHDGLVVAEISPEVTGNAAFSNRTLAIFARRCEYGSRNMLKLQPAGQLPRRREQ